MQAGRAATVLHSREGRWRWAGIGGHGGSGCARFDASTLSHRAATREDQGAHADRAVPAQSARLPTKARWCGDKRACHPNNNPQLCPPRLRSRTRHWPTPRHHQHQGEEPPAREGTCALFRDSTGRAACAQGAERVRGVRTATWGEACMSGARGAGAGRSSAEGAARVRAGLQEEWVRRTDRGRLQGSRGVGREGTRDLQCAQ